MSPTLSKKAALQILLWVVFFIPYVFPSPFGFLPASLLLMVMAWLVWGKSWRSRTGLWIPTQQILPVFALTSGIYLIGRFMIPELLAPTSVRLALNSTWMWKVSPFFQSLNEEVVLRALLITVCLSWVASEAFVSIGVALVFSVLHWFFYYYNLKGPTLLSPLTLFNLFLFGWICNTLFLRYRHIGYGLALHSGWNLTRFGGRYYSKSGQMVLEGQSFNLIEGKWQVTLMLAFFLSLVLFVQPRSARKKGRGP